MIQDKDPTINNSSITFSLVIAFRTYKGEVPMSPKMIPNAINKVATVTLLFLLPTVFSINGNTGSIARRLYKGIRKKTN